MKTFDLHSSFLLFDSKGALPPEVKTLMEEAEIAREKAYAPYSKFRVGAAVLLDNGKVVTGNNQENAAYPSGLCAERVAAFYAHATYPEAKIVRFALTGRSDAQLTQNPIPPCGSCRQAIAEFEVKQEQLIEVYFMGETGQVVKADSFKDLLPFLFEKNYLK